MKNIGLGQVIHRNARIGLISEGLKRSFSWFLIGLMATLADTATAHHSIFALYMDTFAEVEGVVTGMDLRNPHIRLTMLVENDLGEEEIWNLEGDSANAVERRGITRETLRVGDRVRVAGYPSRFGRRELLITNILMPDGKERLMSERPRPWRWAQPPPAEPKAIAAETRLGRSLFRVWSFEEFLEVRKPPVFTPAAQAARAAWDPFDMLALRCIAPGMPNAMHSPYPVEFVDEGDRIRLRIEEWEATRVIDMVATEVPADAPPSRHGYSAGRWEGDALVVETERVEFPYLDDVGTPMSEQVQMRERFTLSEDGSRLDYELIITDPENLLEPSVWDAAWTWVPGKQIMSYECDPEAAQ